jgi:hypothetical protein
MFEISKVIFCNETLNLVFSHVNSGSGEPAYCPGNDVREMFLSPPLSSMIGPPHRTVSHEYREDHTHHPHPHLRLGSRRWSELFVLLMSGWLSTQVLHTHTHTHTHTNEVKCASVHDQKDKPELTLHTRTCTCS